MATKFMPKNAVRAMYRHYDTIKAACLGNNGAIGLTEDSSIIEELSEQKLLYTLDSNHEHRLNGRVRALVDDLEGHLRFHLRHGAIEGNIDDLKEAVEKYNRINLKGDPRSRNQAMSEVNDYIYDLFDNIRDSIVNFYHLVDEDYSLVTDIDEKLRQMNRCSDELSKINEIFKRLTVGRLEEEFQSDDPVINRLIFKDFSKMIAVGINEIAVLSEKIVKRIDKINQEKLAQERNHLIDKFAEIYLDRPDFTPNIETYDIPEKFAVPEPLELDFSPELTTSCDDIPDFYRELSATLLVDKVAPIEKKEIEQSTEVKDNRGNTFTQEKTEIEKRVDFFIQATMSDRVTSTLSASQGYELLKIQNLGISIVDWIYIVMIGYMDLPPDVTSKIKMEPVKVEINPNFTGNVFFKDLVFSKTSKVSVL